MKVLLRLMLVRTHCMNKFQLLNLRKKVTLFCFSNVWFVETNFYHAKEFPFSTHKTTTKLPFTTFHGIYLTSFNLGEVLRFTYFLPLIFKVLSSTIHQILVKRSMERCTTIHDPGFSLTFNVTNKGVYGFLK